MPPHPTLSKNCARYFTCRIGMASLWSACAAVCRANSGLRTTSCALLKVNLFQNLTYHAKSTASLGWNDIQAPWSKHNQDLFATPAFPAQGLSAMLFSPGKGSCRHYRFARALARCHRKQWVPGRLIGLGVRSFRLKILQQNPIFVMNCEKYWGFNHKIPMIFQFQIYI